MKKLKILTLLCIFIAVAIFTSCTQVHRDITPILDENENCNSIYCNSIDCNSKEYNDNYYYNMKVWSTKCGLITRIQPKENFWSIDKWENISLKYTDQNGSYWEESHWAGNRNILELKEIDNWVDEAKAFYFTYPFVEKGKKYTLSFSLNYGYSSTIEITSDYDVLGEVDNAPFFKSWNVVEDTALRIDDESKNNYVVFFNDCSFPNDTNVYKISNYRLGFRDLWWNDQSGSLWSLGDINKYVNKSDKSYRFSRTMKNEEKLYYYGTAYIKPKVAETIVFFDGSENVTIPYGKIEFETTKTYELQIRNR